jgi:hypothetical protein
MNLAQHSRLDETKFDPLDCNHMKIARAILLASVASFIASCAGVSSHRTPPGVTVDLVPKGMYARRIHRPMNPDFITIHATENRSRGAGA